MKPAPHSTTCAQPAIEGGDGRPRGNGRARRTNPRRRALARADDELPRWCRPRSSSTSVASTSFGTSRIAAPGSRSEPASRRRPWSTGRIFARRLPLLAEVFPHRRALPDPRTRHGRAAPSPTRTRARSCPSCSRCWTGRYGFVPSAGEREVSGSRAFFEGPLETACRDDEMVVGDPLAVRRAGCAAAPSARSRCATGTSRSRPAPWSFTRTA